MRQRSIHIAVDAGRPVAIYVQIMDQIREQIGEGGLSPGSPLPSVRELASQLDLNPNTVAKAYAMLEREGTLLTVTRRGTFVAETSGNDRKIDRRADEAVERVLADADARGIDRSQILQALRRRLKYDESRPRRRRR